LLFFIFKDLNIGRLIWTKKIVLMTALHAFFGFRFVKSYQMVKLIHM